jgi:hypothetical protein
MEQDTIENVSYPIKNWVFFYFLFFKKKKKIFKLHLMQLFSADATMLLVFIF